MYRDIKTRNKFLIILILFCISIFSVNANTNNITRIEKHETNIKKLDKRKIDNTLINYINQPEVSSWKIKSEKLDKYYQVRVIKLMANTVKWPDKFATVTTDYPNWRHNVTIHIPKKVKHDTALIYVGCGLLHPPIKKYKQIGINFKLIAKKTSSIVIVVRDLPNQILKFSANKNHPTYNSKTTDTPIEKKGNELFIYTLHKYIEDPKSNGHMPIVLPMAKATMRVMTISQKLLQQKYNIAIDKFVLSGFSKRGWSAFLTAAIDKRVSAVIPIAADFFNIKQLLNHENKNDLSLINLLNKDKNSDTKNFDKLMGLIDLSNYAPYIEIPKFIISSLSDNYLPANHLNTYIHTLPSNNYLRVISNASHYLLRDKTSVINNSILSFYSCFLNKEVIPIINYHVENNNLIITTTQSDRVRQVLLRTTLSRTKNFSKTLPNRNPHLVKRIRFNKNKPEMVINLRETNNLCSAHTLEISYYNKPHPDLVFTSPVFILPEDDKKQKTDL